MQALEFLKELTNPESIIHHGGLLLLLLVIFAENGLVIGFFLPGDSLIFLAGLICGTNGGKTLVLGRFLPIIRTFAPIIAGVIRVPVPTFMFFNVMGGALWITSLSLIGYYLGTQFPAIENYVGYIVIGFIGITTTLLIRTYIKQRREAGARKKQHPTDDDAPILMP